jgi:dehydrogenase/reductase SDR family protein 7B
MHAIQNKVFWITGASSGIGKSLAELIIAKGAKVVLSGRNEKALQEIAHKYSDSKDKLLVLPFDLGAQPDTQALTAEVMKHFGRIDYLINNGGISQRSTVSESSLEVDRKVFEVNFFGNIALTKAVLPIMLKQQSGHIAATSSIVGKFGFPLRSAYSASKHALHGFYESLLAEHAKDGIRVSMIIPGRIQTHISVNAINKEGKAHGEMDPGQAQGMPSDVAARKILRGLIKNKKEILVGKLELLMVHFRRFMPWLYYRMAQKVDPK